MADIQPVKVNRNGSVRLPASVRKAAGIKVGDLLEVVANDGAIQLIRSEPEWHFARWRSISHELLLEKRRRSD